MKIAAVVLASAVLVLGLFLVGHTDSIQTGPTIVAPDRIPAPGVLAGYAHLGGQYVTITVEIIGEGEIPGSPDLVMEGDVNEFLLDVTNEMRHKTLKIIATGPSGTTSVHHVFVD